MKEREKLVSNLHPGAALYKKGDAVIYIQRYLKIRN